MLSDMMTPEQVAGYLQLNKDTIYRLIRQKKLATTRMGRAYRVPRQDLEAFIAANSTRSEVRQSLFKRVLDIARRNPDLNADALLVQLEETDSQAAAPQEANDHRRSRYIRNVLIAAVLAPQGTTRQVLLAWETQQFGSWCLRGSLPRSSRSSAIGPLGAGTE